MAIDYGTDFDCAYDFTEEFRTVSGIMLMAQAVIRRYQTPRGMLIDDPNYGTDLAEFLEEDVDENTLVRMRSDIVSEPRKDERIKNVTVQAIAFQQEDGAPATDLRVVAQLGIELSDSTTFIMTISVSKVTTELLEVTQ